MALFACVPGDLTQLGDAVDQPLDLGAEETADVLGGGAGVLHAIVQQPGADGGHVQIQLGDDLGHPQRVHQVRLTRPSHLSCMPLLGKVMAATDEPDVGGGGALLRGFADDVDDLHQGFGQGVRVAASRSRACARASLRTRVQPAATYMARNLA